ncbi:MAG: phage holin family protein [Pirellulaceae bacterium]
MINTNGAKRPTQSWSMLRSNVTELLHDITTIAELQAKLTMCDMQSSLRQARLPLAVGVSAVVLLLGAVPIGLTAAAESLVQYAEWTRPLAYLTVSGIAAAISIVMLALGGQALRRSSEPLQRSREELAENVRWIRRALRAHGRLENLEETKLSSKPSRRRT